MEQNLGSFSAGSAVTPVKKKTSRTKPVLIVIGSVIGLILLGFIAFRIWFKTAVYDPLGEACKAEFKCTDGDIGRLEGYKSITVGERPAKMYVELTPGLIRGIDITLRYDEDIDVDGEMYMIHIHYAATQIPWDKHYFIGWGSSGAASANFSGIAVNKDNEYIEDGDELTDEDIALADRLKEYWLPLMDHLKAEYERMTDDY